MKCASISFHLICRYLPHTFWVVFQSKCEIRIHHHLISAHISGVFFSSSSSSSPSISHIYNFFCPGKLFFQPNLDEMYALVYLCTVDLFIFIHTHTHTYARRIRIVQRKENVWQAKVYFHGKNDAELNTLRCVGIFAYNLFLALFGK